MKPGQAITVVALLVVHLGIATLLFVLPASSSPTPPHWFLGLMAGWVAGQVSLLAAWTALARTRETLLRLPWALLYLVLLWFVFVAIYRWYETWFLTTVATIIGFALLWSLLMAGGMFHLASRLSRWKLTLQSVHDAQLAAAGQFRIRQLMMLTAVIGVVLGIARLALPTEGWGDLNLVLADLNAILVLSIYVVVNTLSIMPVCLWASSLEAELSVLFLMFCWPIWAALATVAEIGLMTAFAGEPADDSGFGFLLAANLTQGVCVLASLWVLRRAGWRLVRGPANSANSLTSSRPKSEQERP